MNPPDLKTNCDGCGDGFSITHTLYFKRGGLIVTHHNELFDGVADLSVKAFTPLHVCNNPLIYSGCGIWEGKSQSTKFQGTKNPPVFPEELEQKWDLLTRDIWQQRIDIIYNMHFLNTNALSYHNKFLEKFILMKEKDKVGNYL